jgi:hypothetical protein
MITRFIGKRGITSNSSYDVYMVDDCDNRACMMPDLTDGPEHAVFGWGYSGTGPTRLAAALIYHSCGFNRDLAFAYAGELRDALLSVFAPQGFEITTAEVMSVMSRLQRASQFKPSNTPAYTTPPPR